VCCQPAEGVLNCPRTGPIVTKHAERLRERHGLPPAWARILVPTGAMNYPLAVCRWEDAQACVVHERLQDDETNRAH
jgi:hypothetical protein